MSDEFEYPLPGDDEAAEALAAQKLREETDALASEQQEQATDPHAAEREALGFDLAWWGEEGEHGTPPIDIAVDLTNQACGRTQYLRDLEKYGFDPSGALGYVGLDSITGPLVVAGLQILGVLHSHIREDITKVLKQIFDAVPETTDEYSAQFADAAEAHQKAAFADMGIEVIGLEDFAEQAEEAERRRQDAQNN